MMKKPHSEFTVGFLLLPRNFSVAPQRISL